MHHASDRGTHAPDGTLRPHRALLRRARVAASQASHAVPLLIPPHARPHIRAHPAAAAHEQHGAASRARTPCRAPPAHQDAHAAEPPHHGEGTGVSAQRVVRELRPAGGGGHPRPRAPQPGAQPQARRPPGVEGARPPGPRVRHFADRADCSPRPGPQRAREASACSGIQRCVPGPLTEAQAHHRPRLKGGSLRQCRNDGARKHAGGRPASRAARAQPGARPGRPAALPLQRQGQLHPSAAALHSLQSSQGRRAHPDAAGDTSPTAPHPAPGHRDRRRHRGGLRRQPGRAVRVRHAGLHVR